MIIIFISLYSVFFVAFYRFNDWWCRRKIASKVRICVPVILWCLSDKMVRKGESAESKTSKATRKVSYALPCVVLRVVCLNFSLKTVGFGLSYLNDFDAPPGRPTITTDDENSVVDNARSCFRLSHSKWSDDRPLVKVWRVDLRFNNINTLVDS